jgi:hypothetical protein
MKIYWPARNTALALSGLLIVGGLAAQLTAAPQEKTAQGADTPPVAVQLQRTPPTGSLVLFGDTPEQLRTHWFERYGTKEPQWKIGEGGVLTPNGKDITTKQEFGDCYLHTEFRIPTDASGKTLGHGNSGVGLQGRYEIQIMDSYGQKPEKSGNGSLYSQIPAQINASRKPGEWQTFDIIFRAPRFDAGGQVKEKPRATVFHNGVLIHNNTEFTDMTGIQYDQYKTMTPTGPLVIQGDHDPVQYRNIWIVPM